jgi:hypothetical protein
VGERIWRGAAESAGWPIGRDIRESIWDQDGSCIWHSILADDEAQLLTFCLF